MPVRRLELDIKLSHGRFDLSIAETLDLEGVTVLFGPNGAGKSLTLRTIAGLETGAEGVVRFGRETWQDSAADTFFPVHKRPVGFVFQDARLFSHLNVARNLHYALKRAKPGGEAVSLDDVVEVFGIDHLMDRMPEKLSGGERQRVVMARGLLSRPSLMLMDEPLGALDVQARAQALSFIETIPAKFGVPVLYVTHSIDEVVRLADQLVLIAKGRVEASGPAVELMSRLDLPPFTGRFEAGSIISAKIAGHVREFALTELELNPGVRIQVPLLDFPAGQTVRLRIRARDVSIATSRPKGLSMRNVLEARVTEVQTEPDTAFAEVLLDVAGQPLRARVSRAAAHDLKLVEGKKVYALVKATALDRRLLARL